MTEMTYEQTIELERNIKIKNKAKEIVAGFKKNISLNLETKKGLRFTIWEDSHNAEYVEIYNEDVALICDFLNEKYNIVINESSVFSGIKNKDRAVVHLAGHAKVEYNENHYTV